MARPTKEQQEEKARQALLDQLDAELRGAALDAAKAVIAAIRNQRKLSREELGACNLILERVLGKAGTSKAPDPQAEQLNELLSKAIAIRQAAVDPNAG